MTSLGELTRNQALVLKVLEEAKAPLSAYTILDELRDDGLRAPLQVYRALEKLLGLGLAHRLETMNAFVACGQTHCNNQDMIAFAICDKCGKVTEFSDEQVRTRLGDWADEHSFVTERTTMEIRGKCKDCASIASLEHSH